MTIDIETLAKPNSTDLKVKVNFILHIVYFTRTYKLLKRSSCKHLRSTVVAIKLALLELKFLLEYYVALIF